MRKVSVFNHISLDGYFVDSKGDMSWAKSEPDEEFDAFVAENASQGGVLLFGRKTYDLMASYWPTSMAAKQAPKVAEGMNRMSKIVFSRTMDAASWSNTELVKENIQSAVKDMKNKPGPDMVILGSGMIISQLASVSLIDEYQMMVNPIALGSGRTMFEGMKEKLNLKLKKSRVFKNGKIFLCYEPN